MSDEVKKYFSNLLQKISGLTAIVISDRDGVPVLKVVGRSDLTDRLPSRQEQLFLATYSIANEQSSKMLLGRNKSIITMFQKTTVVQFNKYPLIVTFIGSENCNTGHILSVENEVDRYLDDYKQISHE